MPLNLQKMLEERQRLLERIKALEAENAALRKRLGEYVAPPIPAPTAMLTLSLHEKVILGYHSSEDNLIRFKDPEIATNLLGLFSK